MANLTTTKKRVITAGEEPLQITITAIRLRRLLGALCVIWPLGIRQEIAQDSRLIESTGKILRKIFNEHLAFTLDYVKWNLYIKKKIFECSDQLDRIRFLINSSRDSTAIVLLVIFYPV